MIQQLNDVKQAHVVITDLWGKIKTALEAGKRLTIEVKPENKSREQEEMYHALIGKIAMQAQHQGAQWDAESWKRFLVDQWANDTGKKTGKVVASLDGERVVQLGLQTRKFTKEDGTEFIEFLFAWAINLLNAFLVGGITSVVDNTIHSASVLRNPKLNDNTLLHI
jgi:hypothetical protein